MKTDTLHEFIALAKSFHEDDYVMKKAFHSKGRAVLRSIAGEIDLQKGTYEIRSNLGGPAVSGEVTLHGENIYIQFSVSCAGNSFMYRRCNGLKDYTGGRNHWMPYDELENFSAACEVFHHLERG